MISKPIIATNSERRKLLAGDAVYVSRSWVKVVDVFQATQKIVIEKADGRMTTVSLGAVLMIAHKLGDVVSQAHDDRREYARLNLFCRCVRDIESMAARR